MAKHARLRCKNPEHGQRCAFEPALCRKCELSDGQLTTDCPGRYVSVIRRRLITRGRLDYRHGHWVTEVAPCGHFPQEVSA